jgi:hypothetical protein
LRRAVRFSIGVLVLLLVGGLGRSSHAGADEAPDHYRIGAYLVSLNKLDPARGTFDADLWLWSVGRSPARDPLQSMEFVNADRVTSGLESSTQRGELFWRQRKISGTFRHNWDLRNFPFDRQMLTIAIEEGVSDANTLVYEPDKTNTGYRPQYELRGWRVTSIALSSGVIHYATTFGDPAAARGSDYAEMQLAVTLTRTGLAAFLNLSAPLYAAFLLTSVSFLLGSSVVTARMSLLAASLFAVVINIRTTSDMLGGAHGPTLIDKFNILGLAAIVAATFATVAISVLNERVAPTTLARLDYIACSVLVVLFASTNAVLLVAAAFAS